MDETSVISIDHKRISKISDQNTEFRKAIIRWIVNYSKNKKKWGKVKLSRALIENAYPKLINDSKLEDRASHFHETLNSLLNRKDSLRGGVVTLEKNRYLFDIICFFVFKKDPEYFKSQLYESRLESLAKSFLHLNKGLNAITEDENHNINHAIKQGLYEGLVMDNWFWDIRSWKPKYRQVVRVQQNVGDLGTSYIKDLGVLIKLATSYSYDYEPGSHLNYSEGYICFVYSEHSTTVSIYKFQKPRVSNKAPAFLTRTLSDDMYIGYKPSKNELIYKLTSTMGFKSG